jgi:hypothetical protein
MRQAVAFGGALRYEFLMQVRRPALWIGGLLLSAFLFNHFGAFYLADRIPNVDESLGSWAGSVALFFPIAAGLLLADRYTRDRKAHVDELLETSAASTGARLFGKFFGSALATLAPVFLVYMVGAALILAHWGELAAVPLALALFVVVNVTGILFVGAFSIACTTALWPVVYQFLFVGYWFWGNLLNPRLGIPTLNGTLLTPNGRYARAGLFPSTVLHIGIYYEPPPATLAQAIGSLLLLLGCALVALLAAWGWLNWQQQHR